MSASEVIPPKVDLKFKVRGLNYRGSFEITQDYDSSVTRYPKEEFARRGKEIYSSQVRPKIEHGNDGKIVAIDIETGAFEIAKDNVTASDRLLANHPDAQIWFVRVGHPAVHRIGHSGATALQ